MTSNQQGVDSMSEAIVPIEQIASTILIARGQKVMLDYDLARLYGVTTGNLNKAVNRNRGRFPSDFMFQLAAEEAERLIFQFGISKGALSDAQPAPLAFFLVTLLTFLTLL